MISFIGAALFMLDIICALAGHGFAVYVGEFGMFGGAEHLIDQGLHQFFPRAVLSTLMVESVGVLYLLPDEFSKPTTLIFSGTDMSSTFKASKVRRAI